MVTYVLYYSGEPWNIKLITISVLYFATLQAWRNHIGLLAMLNLIYNTYHLIGESFLATLWWDPKISTGYWVIFRPLFRRSQSSQQNPIPYPQMQQMKLEGKLLNSEATWILQKVGWVSHPFPCRVIFVWKLMRFSITDNDSLLHTQLWIDPSEEFVQYTHRGDPVDITFGMKELKVIFTIS